MDSKIMDSNIRKTLKKVYGWAENAERPGGEFDWFAYDQDGCIAVFASAGFGPIPDDVFEIGIEAYLTLVDTIAQKILGQSPFQRGGMSLYSDAGLFVYDFRLNESDQYELTAKPAQALTLLDSESFGIKRNLMVEFPNKFSTTPQVIPEEFWQCR